MRRELFCPSFHYKNREDVLHFTAVAPDTLREEERMYQLVHRVVCAIAGIVDSESADYYHDPG